MATAVQLKRPPRKERFRSDNCILYGKSEKILTSPNGRAKILDAVIAHEDTNLLDRIRSLDDVDDLSYHTDNKCFKSYVLKKTIDRILKVRCVSISSSVHPQCNNEIAPLLKS